MRLIALAILLAVSQPQAASADCISSTDAFKCTGADDDGTVVSNKSFIQIVSTELDVNREFLERFPNATFLHFDDTVLYFPASESSSTFHHLKSLWIMSSIVANFREILNKFDELEEVKVSHTHIDYNILDRYFFRNNKQIKVLKLIDLELRSIELNAFDNLSELNYVEITETQLRTLPENIFEFNKKLVFLILSGNSFTTIPDVSYPGSLQVLKLDKNQITRILKEDLYNLGNLTDLVLNSNSIQHIDEDSFDNCKKMKYVMLASNDLEQISERHFQHMESLEVLDLSFNILDLQKLVKAGIPVIGTVPLSLENLDYYKDESSLELIDKDPSNSKELKDMYYTAVYGSGQVNVPDDNISYAYDDYDEFEIHIDFEGSSEPELVTSTTTSTSRPPINPKPKYEGDDEDLEGSSSGIGSSEKENEPIVVSAGCGHRGFEIFLLLGILLFVRAL